MKLHVVVVFVVEFLMGGGGGTFPAPFVLV